MGRERRRARRPARPSWRKLKAAVEAHADEIVAAVLEDTRKPEGEIRVTEVLNVLGNIQLQHRQSGRVDEADRGHALDEPDRHGA